MFLSKLPILKIRNTVLTIPVVQGGMGIGLSNYTLAGAVATEGGMGVLSSAALDRIISERHGKKFKPREAAAQDVIDAKKLSNGGAIGMNIMVAVINTYEESVLGSMDGGVDAIISGAGLPMSLPEIVLQHPRADEVALIPIVSSGRAAEVILKRWSRSGRLPDAFVVEGPLAGGHIGWRDIKDAIEPRNRLENLIKEVIDVCSSWNLSIPIIAAGGVYTHEDVIHFLEIGCQGVQMGTRFLATHESGANDDYKKQLVECTECDIELASKPGSPCGMLFRVLKQSPFYQQALSFSRAPKCDKGYLLNKGKCSAKEANDSSFCICNGLLANVSLAPNELDLYTVGQTAHRITKIVSVKELMDELQGPNEIKLNFNSEDHVLGEQFHDTF